MRDPGKVELERVVRGEGDVESSTEVLGERAAVVVQEQVIVAEWRHGHAYLSQVEQVLDARDLLYTQHRRTSEHWDTISECQTKCNTVLAKWVCIRVALPWV